MNILVVEDNQDLAANIGEYLETKGEVADYAMDGLTGLHLATTNHYDAIVLDLNLPGVDGLTLCRRLREDAGSVTPILMLTARDTERDKLVGFENGADDYLTKPFSLPEMHARLKAILRRGASNSTVVQVEDLSFDSNTLVARRAGKRLELTPTGLRLLELLMRASPGVVTRQAVERAIWGDDPPDSDAALRGHILALRRAVDTPDREPLLHTVHGIGYRLAPNSGA